MTDYDNDYDYDYDCGSGLWWLWYSLMVIVIVKRDDDDDDDGWTHCHNVIKFFGFFKFFCIVLFFLFCIKKEPKIWQEIWTMIKDSDLFPCFFGKKLVKFVQSPNSIQAQW